MAHATPSSVPSRGGLASKCFDQDQGVMALAQSSSLMTLGLKGDRSMARHNSVPSLGSKVVEFNFGRPNYAVRRMPYTMGLRPSRKKLTVFHSIKRALQASI